MGKSVAGPYAALMTEMTAARPSPLMARLQMGLDNGQHGYGDAQYE
jgi:hypothetical protein